MRQLVTAQLLHAGLKGRGGGRGIALHDLQGNGTGGGFGHGVLDGTGVTRRPSAGRH